MKETHAIMLALPPTEPNGGAIMPLLTGREQIIFPRASALTKATGIRTLAAGAPRQRPRSNKTHPIFTKRNEGMRFASF